MASATAPTSSVARAIILQALFIGIPPWVIIVRALFAALASILILFAKTGQWRCGPFVFRVMVFKAAVAT
jgi:hypothetical protein